MDWELVTLTFMALLVVMAIAVELIKHGQWLAKKAYDAAYAKACAEIRCEHDHEFDATPAEIRESAYRRGFAQGLGRAIAIVLRGGDASALLEYDEIVADWRFRTGKYRGERTAIEPPPAIDERSESEEIKSAS